MVVLSSSISAKVSKMSCHECSSAPQHSHPHNNTMSRNEKCYSLRQGTSKRVEVREGSLRSGETFARAGTLWREGLACMVTK